jgi:L-2-hydroxyglutarate oxidase LhgO
VNATPDVDVVVIGAGVIGLACAQAVSARGRSVWVLEREERAGEGISSRNSGVIHAGFYYPPGSLKARLCLRGRDLLYSYCVARGIGHRRTGKWVVATHEAEVPALQDLLARGVRNGLAGLRLVSASEVLAQEPQLHAVAALDSPDSGIVDVPELVMALHGDIERSGAENRVLCENQVVGVEPVDGLFRVGTSTGDSLLAGSVINAAGLGAVALAQGIVGLAPEHVPQLYYGAGHYYGLRGRVPFSRLIYPLPLPGGLGVHLGLDMAGRARFGPDLRYRDSVDFSFDDSHRERFAAAIQRWWPALEPEALLPDFVGVRPKLVGPGQHNPDFVIQDASVHGLTGLINLFGIESPGLTASLAIGEEVASRLFDAGGPQA